MNLIIGICFLAAILFLYIYVIKKYKNNKLEKQKEEDFFQLALNEYLPILSIYLFSGSTTCVDEHITTTVIDGVYVVQIHIDGVSKRLTLNCYIDGDFTITYDEKTIEIDDISPESIQYAVKHLRVDTQLLTHA